MTFAPIITALSGLYLVVIYALRRRRGLLSQHPYRNPYGDAPGAWRGGDSAADVRQALRRAPGTR